MTASPRGCGTVGFVQDPGSAALDSETRATADTPGGVIATNTGQQITHQLEMHSTNSGEAEDTLTHSMGSHQLQITRTHLESEPELELELNAKTNHKISTQQNNTTQLQSAKSTVTVPPVRTRPNCPSNATFSRSEGPGREQGAPRSLLHKLLPACVDYPVPLASLE